MKNLSKSAKIVGLLLLGLFMGKVITYPWSFSYVQPEDYKDYILIKSAYQHYQDRFGSTPENFKFLPPYIAEKINERSYDFITYNRSNGELCYNSPLPFYLYERGLIDFIFDINNIKATKVLIGYIPPIAPSSFNISDETSEMVRQAPIQKFKTWGGTLEIPVPNGIEIRSNNGSQSDFDAFYLSPKGNKSWELLIYVGHHPRVYKDLVEGKVEPVSLRLMGEVVNGNKFCLNGRNTIEIIKRGGKEGSLMQILLIEENHRELLAEVFNQMKIVSSKEEET